MSKTPEEIAAAALHLPPEQRAELMEALAESLGWDSLRQRSTSSGALVRVALPEGVFDVPVPHDIVTHAQDLFEEPERVLNTCATMLLRFGFHFGSAWLREWVATAPEKFGHRIKADLAGPQDIDRRNIGLDELDEADRVRWQRYADPAQAREAYERVHLPGLDGTTGGYLADRDGPAVDWAGLQFGTNIQRGSRDVRLIHAPADGPAFTDRQLALEDQIAFSWNMFRLNPQALGRLRGLPGSPERAAALRALDDVAEAAERMLRAEAAAGELDDH